MVHYEVGETLSEEILRRLKFAMLGPVRFDSNFKFLENVIVNRGGHLKLFLSREEAIEWLSKEKNRLF